MLLRIELARRGDNPDRLAIDRNHRLFVAHDRHELTPPIQRQRGVHRRKLPVVQDDRRSITGHQKRQAARAKIIAQQCGPTCRDPLACFTSLDTGPDLERQLGPLQTRGTGDIALLAVERQRVRILARAIAGPRETARLQP